MTCERTELACAQEGRGRWLVCTSLCGAPLHGFAGLHAFCLLNALLLLHHAALVGSGEGTMLAAHEREMPSAGLCDEAGGSHSRDGKETFYPYSPRLRVFESLPTSYANLLLWRQTGRCWARALAAQLPQTRAKSSPERPLPYNKGILAPRRRRLPLLGLVVLSRPFLLKKNDTIVVDLKIRDGVRSDATPRMHHWHK